MATPSDILLELPSDRQSRPITGPLQRTAALDDHRSGNEIARLIWGIGTYLVILMPVVRRE